MSSNASSLFESIEEWIDARIESKLNEADVGEGLTEDRVVALIEEHAGAAGLTEAEVLALIEENTTDSGLTEAEVVALIEANSTEGGLSEEAVISLIEEHSASDGDLSDVRDRLEEIIERADGALDNLESELFRVIGPESPSGDYHTTAGWGLHFTADEALTFGATTIAPENSGSVNVELHKFNNGSSEGVVDTTAINIPKGDVEMTVDLDVSVTEPGEYLLTRDYDTEPEKLVSMRRTNESYDFTQDSDEALTLHGSNHPEWSDSSYWYYFFNLQVRPYSDSESE